MGYLNKICKFISRLFTIWKLNQHPTEGKNSLSTFLPLLISTYKYFTISNSWGKNIRRFPTIVIYDFFVYWCTFLSCQLNVKCKNDKTSLIFMFSFIINQDCIMISNMKVVKSTKYFESSAYDPIWALFLLTSSKDIKVMMIIIPS